jgi:hypothetical protein
MHGRGLAATHAPMGSTAATPVVVASQAGSATPIARRYVPTMETALVTHLRSVELGRLGASAPAITTGPRRTVVSVPLATTPPTTARRVLKAIRASLTAISPALRPTATIIPCLQLAPSPAAATATVGTIGLGRRVIVVPTE